MLNGRQVSASIPVADPERAQRWYAEKLGLVPSTAFPDGGALYTSGGSTFTLYRTPSAGQAAHTLAGIASTDIEADVRELKARGVVFEEYDMGDIKTVDSIASLGPAKAAWFRDSEGNILGLFQGPM